MAAFELAKGFLGAGSTSEMFDLIASEAPEAAATIVCPGTNPLPRNPTINNQTEVITMLKRALMTPAF